MRLFQNDTVEFCYDSACNISSVARFRDQSRSMKARVVAVDKRVAS